MNQTAFKPVFQFLSHLSGDEAKTNADNGDVTFLSHLSGDEVVDDAGNPNFEFLSHFLHYPTMGKVVDIGTFRMQNSL